LSKWFKRHSSAELPVKFLCFPYAGGSAQIYEGWHKFFEPLGIEVIAVQYPGRMERIGEPCISSAQQIVSAVKQELQLVGILECPLLVYGHSNGAIAAFEFAHQYELHFNKPLEHLFLAARNVPSDNHRSRSTMSDENLKQELKELNGTPDELLNNKEFMELVLPSLRADFAIGENYRLPTNLQLNSPAHFIYGTDENIGEKDVTQWQQYFPQVLNTLTLPAEHLFVNTHKNELLAMLAQVIEQKVDKKNLQKILGEWC
jgi:medium-chain acyl-[acyl-carrier-protein] hydrolase